MPGVSLLGVEEWFFATAALLVVSGIQKLGNPAPTAGALKSGGFPDRHSLVIGLALVEVAVGGGSLVVGDELFAWAQATLYAVFGGFVVLALGRKIPIASCGCFGRQDTPPTLIHLGVNTLAAAGAILHSRGPSQFGLTHVLAGQPLLGVPYLLFLMTTAYCLYLILSQLPLLRIRL